MDGFGVMYHGNWTSSGKWVTMEVGTVLSLLSDFSPLLERHTVILYLMVLWYCSGQRLDLKKIVINSLLLQKEERKI